MVRVEGNGTTERYGVRGGVGAGVLVVLEEHWLWADVQVEGVLSEMRGAESGMVPSAGA
jgi:hypothetical protein